MNRSFLVVLLSVTMVVMMSVSSQAATLVWPHSFCDNCHGMQDASNLLGSVNACIECHNTSGAAAKKPFDPGDMSNRFGTAANQPATGTHSTHNYLAQATKQADGSYVYVQANVLDSVDPVMAVGSAKEVGATSCERCHNVKISTNNTYDIDKPFLRKPNSNDELCLDCHRNRNQLTSLNGTHPVGVAYSTAYSNDTTAFRKVPTTPNPANYTSKLGNYLKNGNVVCMTCHAPHFADSNSATFDNASTAGGYSNLTSARFYNGRFAKSTGNLLRTDAKAAGAKDTDINLCNSCHKETKEKNHNSKNQNIQCIDCHDAHVDNTPDGSAPNQSLLRRTLTNISTSTGLILSKTVYFNATKGLNYLSPDGTGICQGCHTPPTGGNLPVQHSLQVATAADCSACHNHKSGFAPARCDACHGYPPPPKAAAGYTGDETVSPHMTHAGNVSGTDAADYAFGCQQCHYSGTRIDKHAMGSYQDVFVDSTGTIGAATGYPNITTDYNKTTTTCNNVYCHSNGAPRGGTIAFAPPQWSWGKGALAGKCYSCHGGLKGDSTVIATNAHSRHVTDYGFTCQTCHADTVDGTNAITANGKKVAHVNGVKDVVFNKPTTYTGTFNGSFATSTATCSVSCHQDGLGGSPLRQPLWTEAAANKGANYCGSCHAAAPTSNQHTVHFSAAYGPQLGTSSTICSTCHNYADKAPTHANGTVDLLASPCAGCHPNTTPLWSAGSTVTCESCHVGKASVVTTPGGTYTAPLKNSFAASRHGQVAGVNVCTTCHDANAAHIGASGQKRLLAYTGANQCDQCHTAAGTSAFKTQSSAWMSVHAFNHYTAASALKTTASGCTGCHDPHEGGNLHMIRMTINGQTVTLSNISSGFIEQTPTGTGGTYRGLCQVCHTKTLHYRNNGNMDLHNGGKWCLNCHSHKTGFAPNGSCNACHGYPPVQTLSGIATMGNFTGAKLENYSGGGGAHTVPGHMLKGVKPTQSFTACKACHYDAASVSPHPQGGIPMKPGSVRVVVDPQYRFNRDLPITYSGTLVNPPARNITGSCSNVSCHFKPSPKWSSER